MSGKKIEAHQTQKQKGKKKKKNETNQEQKRNQQAGKCMQKHMDMDSKTQSHISYCQIDDCIFIEHWTEKRNTTPNKTTTKKRCEMVSNINAEER